MAAFVSLTGVDVKVFAAGRRAIRAESRGIETYDISNPMTPRMLDQNNTDGAVSFAGVAVAVGLVGGLQVAVRATPIGIEVFDLTRPGLPLLAPLASSPSNTGVAVAISGTTVFRGWHAGIDAIGIAAPNAPAHLSRIKATPAFTGVALTGR
jgi:hypothetical protein